MTMDLTGKVALVTGASRGIGAATAILLAGRGAAVAVNYCKNKAAAEAVVKTITGGGGKATAVQADVRDGQAVKKMAADTVSVFGPIDILILNAGAEVPFKPFINLSFDDFERKVMGELKGFFHPLQEVVPGMIARKSGCIVGISSGLSRHPGYGFSAHTTVKSAVDGLMKSLALELGPVGIRVNTQGADCGHGGGDADAAGGDAGGCGRGGGDAGVRRRRIRHRRVCSGQRRRPDDIAPYMIPNVSQG
jgi:3-oxoacyl-[acyl-carrier protein] reductase